MYIISCKYQKTENIYSYSYLPPPPPSEVYTVQYYRPNSSFFQPSPQVHVVQSCKYSNSFFSSSALLKGQCCVISFTNSAVILFKESKYLVTKTIHTAGQDS